MLLYKAINDTHTRRDREREHNNHLIGTFGRLKPQQQLTSSQPDVTWRAFPELKNGHNHDTWFIQNKPPYLPER